ncbi:hypothetical protein [Bacillus mobilis]|uniref:hypothetical protein n=1 Tax=Bacillus mobilis TaxID=2026190 RepID=UPI00330CF79A|nr:hypothetical protein [Bacillus mobilis]
MYYANQDHKYNYLKLLVEKGIKHGQDPEYEAAFYITAYPEIHKCFDWNEFKTEFSPLGSLLTKERTLGVNTAPLTGSTLPLVKAGQSLFNGYKVDLSDLVLYNEELFNVFVQACKIRGRI